MTLVRSLQKAIDRRALSTFEKAKPTQIGYEAEKEAVIAISPMYLQEVPRTVAMVAYRLSNTSTVFDFSQYKRKSTYLEVRYEDKYYYQKVNVFLKDVDFAEFLEEIV